MYLYVYTIIYLFINLFIMKFFIDLIKIINIIKKKVEILIFGN